MSKEHFTKTDSGCWVWNGATAGESKYGVLSFFKRNVYVHRVAYRLLRGKVPPHLYVLHRCDNPPCFNPDHLFLGTARDNVRDMIRKGRANPKKPGTPGTSFKFSPDVVREIRSLHASGMPPKELRMLFNIGHAQLWRITRNKARKECLPTS